MLVVVSVCIVMESGAARKVVGVGCVVVVPMFGTGRCGQDAEKGEQRSRDGKALRVFYRFALLSCIRSVANSAEQVAVKHGYCVRSNVKCTSG